MSCTYTHACTVMYVYMYMSCTYHDIVSLIYLIVPTHMSQLVHYESIQEVRSSKPVYITPQTPSGQHELYSQVFDALPEGKSTKIAKMPTIIGSL